MNISLLPKIGLSLLRSTASAVFSCMSPPFWVRMDLDKSRDSKGPLVDERLFGVSQNTNLLELDFIVNTAGSSGILQVSDSGSGKIIWQSDVEESAVFTQALGPLEKGRAYMIRFIGAVTDHVAITVSSRSEFIQELVQRSSQPGELAHSA